MATNGVDSNSGTGNSPFATIMRAQTAASSGDTVWLRGGTYFLSNSNLTTTNSPWAIVNNLTKSRVNYLAWTNELPVFDFSVVEPIGHRVTAFYVTANDCVFRGFDVVGVTVNVTGVNSQSECFRIGGGDRNRFERLRMHDGMGIGWYLTSGASNLVLNCDAWNNRGLDSFSLGNIDGFGAHTGSTNDRANVFRGCRAWFNSDDGYDCINCFAPVTFDNCWAFYNGYFTNFSSSTGDANGFKIGGYGVSASRYPTNNIPRNLVQNCLAVRNRANGIYANHHLGGNTWLNNTSYRNGTDYNFLCSTNNASSAGDCPGYDHVIHNNLGYKGGSGGLDVANLGADNVTNFNHFTLPVSIRTNDFITLNESLLTAPRQPNGDLPYVNFARLTNTSDCLNVGTNVGLSFYDLAPELGAFEVGPTNAPEPVITKFGTNVILTASGWANRTNYLLATTNLTLASWPRIATNFSDLNGNVVFTNSIVPGMSGKFYRLAIP